MQSIIIAKIFFDTYLCAPLTPAILTIYLAGIVFKKPQTTKNAFNVIRWIIISYIVFNLILLLFETKLTPNNNGNINANSPYFVSLTLIIISILTSIGLLFKRLAHKFWYIFLSAIITLIISNFEEFIKLLTSLHREANYSNENILNEILINVSQQIIFGFILGSITFILVIFFKKKNRPSN